MGAGWGILTVIGIHQQSSLNSLANILNPSSSCLGSLNVRYHALRLLVNTHCRTMQSRAISSTVNPRVYTKLLNRKKTFVWVMHVHTEPITRPISRTVNLENIASSLFHKDMKITTYS